MYPKEVPVTFSHNGKTVSGMLSNVSGAGSNSTFFLTVDRFHLGQLSYVEDHLGFNGKHAVKVKWQFHSNSSPELSSLAEYFGSVVIAEMDGQRV